jgi:hypothetical protein
MNDLRQQNFFTALSSLQTHIPALKDLSALSWAVTTIALLIAYLTRVHFYRGLNKVPGPFLASISSFWKWNIVRQEQMPFRNTELHEKYGPVVRIGPNHVSASSAESISVVHRHGGKTGFTKVSKAFKFTEKRGGADTVYSLASMAYSNRAIRAPICTMSSPPRMQRTIQHSSEPWEVCTQPQQYLVSNFTLTTAHTFSCPR